MKKIAKSNKAFTLAEMLIVVAIIGILLAVMMVTISNAMEKSREAVDLANIRSAMFEIAGAVNSGVTTSENGIEYKGYNGNTYYCKNVPIKQKEVGWVTSILKTKKNNIYIDDIAIACSQDNISMNGFRVKYVVETQTWQVTKPNKTLTW